MIWSEQVRRFVREIVAMSDGKLCPGQVAKCLGRLLAEQEAARQKPRIEVLATEVGRVIFNHIQDDGPEDRLIPLLLAFAAEIKRGTREP